MGVIRKGITHKKGQIRKSRVCKTCEDFADEYGMTMQRGVLTVTISDGTTDVIIDISGRKFWNKTTKESGQWCNARACLMNQFKK